jgi:hypothetical protein
MGFFIFANLYDFAKLDYLMLYEIAWVNFFMGKT